MNEYTSVNHQPLVHKFEPTRSDKRRKGAVWGIAIIGCGLLSGFLLSRFTSSGQNIPGVGAPQGNNSGGQGGIVGIDDDKTFPDSTEGKLEEGGMDGEGTHHLVRPGGESQTVYLTSSVLDLNQYVGKNVRIWGQTFAAKKAAWLMDVGKIQTLGQ